MAVKSHCVLFGERVSTTDYFSGVIGTHTCINTCVRFVFILFRDMCSIISVTAWFVPILHRSSLLSVCALCSISRSFDL